VTKRFCFLTTFYPPFNFGGDGLAVQRMAGGGVLFNTPGELPAAMRALPSGPHRRDDLGRAGYRAFCAHRSESAVIPRYLEIVEDARARRTADQTAAASVALQHAKP
jgi:hypothetical protein